MLHSSGHFYDFISTFEPAVCYCKSTQDLNQVTLAIIHITKRFYYCLFREEIHPYKRHRQLAFDGETVEAHGAIEEVNERALYNWENYEHRRYIEIGLWNSKPVENCITAGDTKRDI